MTSFKMKNLKLLRPLIDRRISRRRKMALLIFFWLATACICYYVAQRSFSRQWQLQFSTGQIRVPELKELDALQSYGNFEFHDDAYKRIQDFKNHLDSLSQTHNGNRLYDSLLRARPGLIDSIKIL